MTKAITIDPCEERKPSVVRSIDIPVNVYKSDPIEEKRRYGSANLVRIFRDMVFIREFETMLDRIKKEGSYEGIQYNYVGPMHLSIGQEAASVGQAYHLDLDDKIFGSHRSHGEVLAKSFSSIAKLAEAELLNIMETYGGGAPLRVAETFTQGSIKDLAINYVLYGALAEIFGRANGFNRGMGGSMHAFFPPFGSMPNNAIVGGSAPIAVGAALFKRINGKTGICIANLGDGAMGCGPVWEAMNFAAMDQYRTLWGKDLGGNPPILFNFMNNFYSQGGQPVGETMGYKILARVGLGVNPEAMHAERVDGYNPLAVADAIERKKKVLLDGLGPVLLDVVTYRYLGHSPSDASTYRDKSEIDLWRKQDALDSYRKYLEENKHADARQLDTFVIDIRKRLVDVLRAASSFEISPRFSIPAETVENLMFSNGAQSRMAEGEPAVLVPKEESRLKITKNKNRFGLKDGKPLSRLETLTFAEAIFEALVHRFYEDPTMIAYGEENRDWGGAFGVYRGLTECLPYHRLFNTPISEAAIAGSAVGYAMSGGRVVVEIMYSDFIGRAGDEIFNQMAKWQAMSGGILKMPLVLRISVGFNYGAQHAQEWTAMAAHVPGLRIMYPATAYDAKGMLNLALNGTDPVVFFESQRLYNKPEVLVEGGVPVEYYEVPLGEPMIRRRGSDLTIVTIGAVLYKALEAAEVLERSGISAEVIDTRFINPLRYEKIIESVRKTRRMVVVSDACERGSFAHTIASKVSQIAFDSLDGPVAVVGARNWIAPFGDNETLFFPQKEWIIDTINEYILPIPGYAARTDQSAPEAVKQN